jgi:hypothetical protein
MHDISRIGRQLQFLLAVFFSNHSENVREFCQSLLPGRHESIATRDRLHLSNPGSLSYRRIQGVPPKYLVRIENKVVVGSLRQGPRCRVNALLISRFHVQLRLSS